ncbi:MAG: IclR family transcriptional regulator [Rhodospirillaceae bacterium]
MTSSDRDEDQKTIRSIERAIDVLACFDRASPQLSVTDLQKRLGLTRPTIYRILATLEGKGLIRSFGNPQRFELGHGASRLAANWTGSDEFVRAARPILHRLWKETDETVALFVAGSNGEKICIEELQSPQALTFTRGVGFTEKLSIGASGKAMLAFMPEAPDDTEYAEVRRRGICVSEGEIIEGAVSVAAPVFGRNGEVAGGLCLFGPEVRLTGERRDNCIARVRTASDEISRTLGFRPSAAAE